MGRRIKVTSGTGLKISSSKCLKIKQGNCLYNYTILSILTKRKKRAFKINDLQEFKLDQSSFWWNKHNLIFSTWPILK